MAISVKEYIEKQNSPQNEICKELRDIILRTFPDIKEEMKLGVPYYEDKFYIVALKGHVNLGFSIEGLSDKEISFFDGGGRTTKHIRIYTPEEIDEKRIKQLLRLVYER